MNADEIGLEHRKIKYDMIKFGIGTVLLGLIALGVHLSIKWHEGERLEFELMGKYIDYALSDNVATRERFARYFWRVSRSEEMKARWAAYLADVVKERGATESKKAALETQAAELARLAASDKAKAEELKAVTRKLDAVIGQLEVRRSAVAPGALLEGHAAGSAHVSGSLTPSLSGGSSK